MSPSAPTGALTTRPSPTTRSSGWGEAPLGRTSASDADAAVAAAMAEHADPWPRAHVIDTTGTVEESLQQALALVDDQLTTD